MPTRAVTHDLTIEPVALREIEPGRKEPRIPGGPPGRGRPRPRARLGPGGPGQPAYRAGSEDRATLPLRGGDQAELGGMGIVVEGGPGAWRLTTANGFEPWVALRDGSTLIEVGPFVIGPVR